MDQADDKPGYHVTPILKGQLGEVSKIREEFEEFQDALRQNAKLMSLIELSDMLGAIDAFLKRNHPSITLDDLMTMMKITQRAFINGHR